MNFLRTAIPALLTFVSLAASALAGGSFDLADIRPLLKDSKEWPQIEKQYEVSPVGSAIRLGNQWTELGGRRCGPYQLDATLKGAKGLPTHNIRIETHITFLKGGKPITQKLESNADDLSETFVRVTVTENGKSAGNEKSPEALVRRYFDQVNERNLKAAFGCFSPGFQERRPLKAYGPMFEDTKSVELFYAKTAGETKEAATVSIRMVVWDAKDVSSAWSGTLGLTKGEGGWKIDDMSQLIQK